MLMRLYQAMEANMVFSYYMPLLNADVRVSGNAGVPQRCLLCLSGTLYGNTVAPHPGTDAHPDQLSLNPIKIEFISVAESYKENIDMQIFRR